MLSAFLYLVAVHPVLSHMVRTPALPGHGLGHCGSQSARCSDQHLPDRGHGWLGVGLLFANTISAVLPRDILSIFNPKILQASERKSLRYARVPSSLRPSPMSWLCSATISAVQSA